MNGWRCSYRARDYLVPGKGETTSTRRPLRCFYVADDYHRLTERVKQGSARKDAHVEFRTRAAGTW